MKILIVTGMEGAENCAATLAKLLGPTCESCEVAQGRKTAVAALKRTEFAAVVVDEAIIDTDAPGAEMIWEHAGLAIPVQINFALSGAQRLAREIRMALNRRERERALAREAAAAAMGSELKSTVAGLLLHSQLALADREITPPLKEKLRVVADLAGSLREQLASVPTSQPPAQSPSQTRI
jgi:signal transduction histidine kinase